MTDKQKSDEHDRALADRIVDLIIDEDIETDEYGAPTFDRQSMAERIVGACKVARLLERESLNRSPEQALEALGTFLNSLKASLQVGGMPD